MNNLVRNAQRAEGAIESTSKVIGLMQSIALASLKDSKEIQTFIDALQATIDSNSTLVKLNQEGIEDIAQVSKNLSSTSEKLDNELGRLKT
jgi:methyl-accepting chemotaxis protein